MPIDIAHRKYTENPLSASTFAKSLLATGSQ